MINNNTILTILSVILAGAISFSISLWFIKKFIKDRNGLRFLVDIPNIRSSHKKITLRVGGMGIILGMLFSLIICFLLGEIDMMPVQYSFVLICLAAMSILGFCSDRFHISNRTRLFVQLIFSFLLVVSLGSLKSLEIAGYRIEFGFFGIFLGILWLVAITNFYNFMDGIDCLAAMQGIIAGIALMLFGIIIKDQIVILPALILTSATAGFILFNITPAKLFMGDVGSYPIGFYIASFGIINSKLFVPVALVLGVFIFDTVVTLFRRIMRGERWYQAHRSHFYQRATNLGYTHMQITLVLSLTSILLTILGCIYLKTMGITQLLIIFLGILLLVSLSSWITMKERLIKIKK